MTRYRVQRWRNRAQSFFSDLSADVCDWLFDSSSLTTRLIKQCHGQFSVRVISEVYASPRLSERRALGMKNRETALIREVHLLCDDCPVVYARTVIPFSTLSGPQQKLTRLGNKSLGAILFSDKTMQRGEVQIARLKAEQVKLENSNEENIWGRRSVFKLNKKPLLVSEYFLPELFY